MNDTLEPLYTDEDLDDEGVQDEAINEPQPHSIFSISSYGADYDVDGLVKRLDNKSFYTPPFQRSFVWNRRQASRFIESLLMGLPVPGIFVFKEADTGKHLIIDGQQRLTSLYRFYQGIFDGREFRLIDVREPWNNLTYAELPAEDRRRLDDSIVHTTVFKQDEPKGQYGSIYEVFERINTGGIKLLPQEIRSCVYHGKFVLLLARLNENSAWRAIYGEESKRLKDQELILRFLALAFALNKYGRPMKTFLNDFMEAHRNLDTPEAKGFTAAFEQVVELAARSFGDRAFRPEGALNAAVFDAVTVGLWERLRRDNIVDPLRVQAAYQSLLANDDFRAAYQRSTADDEQVRKRIDISVAAFSST